MMQIYIRPYRPADLSAMAEIWNEVVRQGEAFPQLETLEAPNAASFSQNNLTAPWHRRPKAARSWGFTFCTPTI